MAASRRSMTAPSSNKADPAQAGEEIARTLYGVFAADRYVPPQAFSATIVKDTTVPGRFAADVLGHRPAICGRRPSKHFGACSPISAWPAATGCCGGRRVAM